MNIEISNIDLNVIESDLRRLFTPFGEVRDVELLRDKWNNRSTGRALVNMPVEKQAQAAIVTLNGTKLSGKAIMVNRSTSTPSNDD
ncbi:MAG TPA: RNA-binding protein [Flavisolibacter sp.]|jgi:RNA recognition motif-containing protein